jgi:hypothetical protein
MCNKSIICGVLFDSGAITFYEGNTILSALLWFLCNSLYHFERIPGNIPGTYVSLESEIIRYIKYHVNLKQTRYKLKFRGTGQKLVEFETLSCCPFL